MDFQTLARRDLQALCKKNRIPANITNAAMVDALRALSTVEGIAEIQEALQYQSPKKSEANSPDMQSTGRRFSSRRVPSRDEPKEGQASPLPRARRVTAKASEIMSIVAEGEGDKSYESPKKPETRSPDLPRTGRRVSARRAQVKVEPREGVVTPLTRTRKVIGTMPEPEKKPKTPAACTGTKTRALQATKGKAKKEEDDKGGSNAGIPPTPMSSRATNTRKRVGEKEVVVQAKVPNTPATRSCRVTRGTGQASNKKAEEKDETMTIGTGRRSTRGKGAAKTACMMQETEEKSEVIENDSMVGKTQEEDEVIEAGMIEIATGANAAANMASMGQEINEDGKADEVPSEGETEVPLEQNEDCGELVMEEMNIMATNISVLCPTDPQSEMEEPCEALDSTMDGEAGRQDQYLDLVIKESETIQDSLCSILVEADESNGDCKAVIEEGLVDQVDSPILGLVEYNIEEDGARGSDQLTDKLPLENSGMDLNFYPQETPSCDESPAEMKTSSDQSPVDKIGGDFLSLPQADSPIIVPATCEFDHASVIEPEETCEFDHASVVEPVETCEFDHASVIEPEEICEFDHASMIDPEEPFDDPLTLSSDACQFDHVLVIEPEEPFNDPLIGGAMVETKGSSVIEPEETCEFDHASMIEPGEPFNDPLTLSSDACEFDHVSVIEPEEPFDDPLIGGSMVETKGSGDIILDDASSTLPLVPLLDISSDAVLSPIKAPSEVEVTLTEESGSHQLEVNSSQTRIEEPIFHDKENKGREEAKVKNQKEEQVHYSHVSLRKLKAIYKEKLISTVKNNINEKEDNTKVEVKRTALTTLNGNLL